MIETITAPAEEIAIGADSLFYANDRQAAQNRALFGRHGITAIDVMGAIGSGKTTLVTRLTSRLKSIRRLAVINGDPSTTDDIVPIAELGVPVVQIAADACHLDANLVAQGLARLPVSELDLILIENVGNLICPGNFDLGSAARVVVVSVTEGPWMVRKHPAMFRGADLLVINKHDLADAMAVSVDGLLRDAHRLSPELPVIVTSCRTGDGLDELAAVVNALQPIECDSRHA